MRSLSALVVLVTMAATATGQWVDRTLWIPDSMYGIAGSDRMLLDPTTGRLWFAGYDAGRVQVYDPSAGAKVTVIAGEDGEITGVTALAQSTTSHRVYIAGYPLTVVDDRDFSVTAQYNISGARSLAYDSRDDKMYTTMFYPDSVILIYKPGPDTLVGSMDIDGYIRTLVYDSARNRLFAVRESADIAVFDCSTDSLVAYLPVSGEPVWDIALNQDTRRLYSISRRSPMGSDIRVYNADSLTAIETISLPDQWSLNELRLALNPATNRLYAWYGGMLKRDYAYDLDSVAVLACSTGMLSFVVLPDGDWCRMVTPAGSKAYVTSWYGDSVAVLGEPDSITDWITATGRGPSVAGWDPGRNEVYISDYDEQLSVVDVPSDSVVRTMDYSHLMPFWFLWNPAGKMYAGSDVAFAVLGVDGTLLSRHRMHSYDGRPPAWSEQLNRLYFVDYDTLWIWNCIGDSVVRQLHLPTSAQKPWAVPGRNRVYLSTLGGDTLLVYDTYIDTLVRVIPALATSFVHNPRTGLVYGFRPNGNDVVVIDPRLDSVVATLDANGSRDVVVNTRDNEVYVSRGSSFLVFDGITHEKTGQGTLPSSAAFCYVEDCNQLLAFSDTIGWAFDCPARQKNRTFTMPSGTWKYFSWNSRNNKLYVHGDFRDTALAVVALPYDTVVAALPLRYTAAMGWNPITNETYVSDYFRIIVVRDAMTGVEDACVNLARPSLRIEQNPSAGSVHFACAASAPAQLQVYDMTGRLVWSRMLTARAPGVVWDRADVQGRVVPRGVYFARLESASGRATVKVVLK